MATFYVNLLIYIYICLNFSRVDLETSGSSRIVVIKSNAWEGSLILIKKSFRSGAPGLLKKRAQNAFPGRMVVEFISIMQRVSCACSFNPQTMKVMSGPGRKIFRMVTFCF